MLLLPALAVLFLTPMAPAADGPTELGKISQQLDLIRQELQSLRNDLRDAMVLGARNAADIKDLQRRVDDLQAQLHRMDDAQRRAFSIIPNGGETTRLPVAGTLVLRNRSGYTGTFSINGNPYVVPPYRSVEVAGVPAGTFTYEIAADGFGVIRPLTTRVLTANTTYFLNIDP
jgi:hypothetical protein